jgi:hypothetical protein
MMFTKKRSIGIRSRKIAFKNLIAAIAGIIDMDIIFASDCQELFALRVSLLRIESPPVSLVYSTVCHVQARQQYE